MVPQPTHSAWKQGVALFACCRVDCAARYHMMSRGQTYLYWRAVAFIESFVFPDVTDDRARSLQCNTLARFSAIGLPDRTTTGCRGALRYVDALPPSYSEAAGCRRCPPHHRD